MRLILIVILALLTNDPREIAKVNALKKEAEEAFLNGNYELAINKYKTLYDSLGIDEDEIKLNLAHAYYNLSDTGAARLNYNNVSTSSNSKLKSIAYQQLGVMSKEAGKLEESLQQLKSAIKTDPTNQEARYNYEVVKKLLEEQQQDQQQQQDQENQEGEDEQEQNQDQQQQENQENQDQEGEQQEQEQQEQEGEKEENQEQKEGEEQQEEKSQEEMTKEKLQEMNISEEKAKMILEAMKNNEIQYLQQQKRKATERPPSGKPDW